MKTSDSTNACPKCGATVPPEAPQGLCPQCVFGAAAAPQAAPTATSQIPSLERLAVAFPQLQVLELIGRGGMGFVFKARQPHLDRFVALKLLPDSLAHDAHFAERFNREGRTLARLNHPNIVSIFDFGQAGGFYFLLMEYVDGVNLRQAMQAGKFSPSEALAIVPKICAALQFAHEEGVLHRDIKPENILLDAKGRVKIADFGIAKIIGEEKPDVSLTATGAALGTPHYMAPEQFEKPATVDHRADIYSLGVVFYEMLTGELPIGRFSPPSQRTPVDPRVDDVVMRTLEKEREKRFQSAGEMKTNVEHLTDAGAGNFKAAPPKMAGANAGQGASGTIVIKPENVLPNVPKWSLKAVWGAALVGISFVPMIGLLGFALAEPRSGPRAILALALLIVSLPAVAGTILGWMGLSDIRAQGGKLRGLPLAVSASLVWPLLLLVGVTLVIFMIAVRPGHGLSTAGAMVLLLFPAGTVTFAIWAVYAAARWGANQPAPERRGKLKWIFLGAMACGVGLIAMSASSHARRERAIALQTEPAADVAALNLDYTPITNNLVMDVGAFAPITNTFTINAAITPWIRFTFTAVELREAKGVRWLAIDYLDDVHGEVQKAFPWETTIPGFKAETRTTEFIKKAKDSSPAVRHQRVEYRMPDSIRRDQLERLRDYVARALIQKSFRLELGEEILLFELLPVEGGLIIFAVDGQPMEADVATGFGGSFKARIKAMPPLKLPEPSGSPEYRQAVARLETLLKKEQELSALYSDAHPLMVRIRAQIEDAWETKKRLEPPLTEPSAGPLALQFRLVADETDAVTPVNVMMESRSDGTTVPLRVLRTVLLDGSAVARAGIVLETNGHRSIGIELTAEGARQFGAITAANLNRKFAIVAGDRVLSAPIIRSPIHGGELQITGRMSAAEVHKLVATLNRTTAAFRFSEPVERSLPLPPATPGLAVCLSLESGNFVTNHAWRPDLRSTRDWARTNRADLIAYGPAELASLLIGLDWVAVEAPPNSWDSLPPEDVIWNWTLLRNSPEEQFKIAARADLPDTFLFCTRQNEFGLLQILSATDANSHMKIRYKLVKSSLALPPKSAAKVAYTEADLPALNARLKEAESAYAMNTNLLSTLAKLDDERRFAVLSTLPNGAGLRALRAELDKTKLRLKNLAVTSLPSERQALTALMTTIEKQLHGSIEGGMISLEMQTKAAQESVEDLKAELEKARKQTGVKSQ